MYVQVSRVIFEICFFARISIGMVETDRLQFYRLALNYNISPYHILFYT
jgi:hypothetical protein